MQGNAGGNKMQSYSYVNIEKYVIELPLRLLSV